MKYIHQGFSQDQGCHWFGDSEYKKRTGKGTFSRANHYRSRLTTSYSTRAKVYDASEISLITIFLSTTLKLYI